MTPHQSPQPVRDSFAGIDWDHWIRNTERNRRLFVQEGTGRGGSGFWGSYYAAATHASFRLDGLILDSGELSSTRARGSAGKAVRPRQHQRARNHVAILRQIERLLRGGHALTFDEVVRWYTSISCGLSTTRLDLPTTRRLEAVVRQINSPHLRLCPAVQAIARLHRQLLADPIVPGFNGILARLLLRYHLGRCGLPPVVFVPETDGAVLLDEQRLLVRLLRCIDEAYVLMLARG